MKPRFAVGEKVRVHKPEKAEHGMSGVIGEVRPYDGPRCLDEWMYRCDENGWKWACFEGGVMACLPERWLRRT